MSNTSRCKGSGWFGIWHRLNCFDFPLQLQLPTLIPGAQFPYNFATAGAAAAAAASPAQHMAAAAAAGYFYPQVTRRLKYRFASRMHCIV